MKTINKLFASLMAVAGLLSCEDEDKTPYLHAPDLQQGAYFRTIENGGLFNKLDFGSSDYSITGEVVSQDPATVSSISLSVAFVDNTFEDETDDDSVGLTLFETASVSSLTINANGFPEKTFEAAANDVFELLDIDPAIVEGGDTILFSTEITMADGTVFSSQNTGDSVRGELFFQSPLDYATLVVCILPEVPAGDWLIEMADSFGDGWQTDDGNGGSGITVTLSTGDVFEVGLCSPYVEPSYDCTNELESGSAIITIPPGITSAEWYFPGDAWGEISFNIYAPSGNLVASVPTGAGKAGPISLNLCNEE